MILGEYQIKQADVIGSSENNRRARCAARNICDGYKLGVNSKNGPFNEIILWFVLLHLS